MSAKGVLVQDIHGTLKMTRLNFDRKQRELLNTVGIDKSIVYCVAVTNCIVDITKIVM